MKRKQPETEFPSKEPGLNGSYWTSTINSRRTSRPKKGNNYVDNSVVRSRSKKNQRNKVSCEAPETQINLRSKCSLATSSNNHNDDSHGKKGINFVNNSDITHVNTQCKFVESTTVGQKKHQSEQNFGRRCSLAASSKKQKDDVNDSVTNSDSNVCIKPPSSVTPLNTNNQTNDSVESKMSVSFHSTTTIIQPCTTNTASTDNHPVVTADQPSSTKSLCTTTKQLNEDKSSNSVLNEKRKDTQNNVLTLCPLSTNTQPHPCVPANGAFVGFANNGSTCFLNTALQCLQFNDSCLK